MCTWIEKRPASAHLNAIRCSSKPFNKGKFKSFRSISLCLAVAICAIKQGQWFNEIPLFFFFFFFKSDEDHKIHCLHSIVQCCVIGLLFFFFHFCFYSHWVFHFIASLQSKYPSKRVASNSHSDVLRHKKKGFELHRINTKIVLYSGWTVHNFWTWYRFTKSEKKDEICLECILPKIFGAFYCTNIPNAASLTASTQQNSSNVCVCVLKEYHLVCFLLQQRPVYYPYDLSL